MLEPDKVVINLPHHSQNLHWDCGLSCIAMVLPSSRREGYLQNLPQICKDEEIKESTWTIDLSYILQRFDVKHLYTTTLMGVQPGYSLENFYKNVIDKDSNRVSRKFRQAAEFGVSIEEREVAMDEILAHLGNKGPIIMLVNANTLICNECSSNKQTIASCLPWISSYHGHYIVLVGYSLASSVVYYRNPSLSNTLCSISFAALDNCRQCFGTDEDILFVENQNLDRLVT